MSSRIVLLADAIVNWINDPARQWGLPVVAVRNYVTSLRASQLEELVVDVVPSDESDPVEPITRGSLLQSHAFAIGVRQRYLLHGPIDPEWMAERLEFVERLSNEIFNVELVVSSDLHAIVTNVRELSRWNQNELMEQRMFGSVLEVVVTESRRRHEHI